MKNRAHLRNSPFAVTASIEAPALPPAISSPLSPQSSVPVLAVQKPLPDDPVVEPESLAPEHEAKDLSFLLDTSIYHPLSQLDVPAAFRRPFPPQPNAETPLSNSLAQLEIVLSQCDYLAGAHLAGGILTSGSVKPTNAKTIFHLLEVRYSCLELSGNVLLAAQEAKALEDLTSTFYYLQAAPENDTSDETDQVFPLPKHVMPFSLRIQAVRLQSIGFSDPRRGVSALYDLGLECRENILSPFTEDKNLQIWTDRLGDIGIRVVNSLIEMGDLSCAMRTLKTMKSSPSNGPWTVRMVLLLLKMGNVAGAKSLIQGSSIPNKDKSLISCLLLIADGLYEEASAQIADDLSSGADVAISALLKQNLAVALLYDGELQKARQMLEELVAENNSFGSLTVNLATLYDLTSDRSRDLKLAMADEIGQQQSSGHQPRAFTNTDFKL